MGNKISTPKILPYAVAQKRFESEEWAALDAGFSRLCNEDGLLEAREFRLHVLGLHVPATMGSSLFYTFNSKRLDGISRKEFLSGVSILLRGTNKERVALVFATFDEDRNGKISRRDVDTWLQICKQNMVDTQFVESLKDLFDEQDSSEYEYGYHQAELDHRQFEDWCNGYFAEDQVIPAIISWAWDLLRDERLFGVSEDSLFRARRGRDAGVPDKLWKRKHESTAFNEKEVAELEQTYHRLRVASPNLAVSELLREIFPPSTPSDMLKRIVSAFDTDNDGEIDAREFVAGMASCCRGSDEEKMRFAFNLYDTHKTGKLDRQDMVALVKSLWKITQINAAQQIPHTGNLKTQRLSPEVIATNASEPSLLAEMGLAEERSEHVEGGEEGELEPATSSAARQALPSSPPVLVRRPSSIPVVNINNVPTSALNVSVQPPEHFLTEHKGLNTSDMDISMSADDCHEMAVELADSMFTKHDVSRDSYISFEEFLMWTQENALAKQFFTAIAAFTSVTLGLRLHDPHQERLLLEKHLTDVPLTCGEEVFVLSSGWLQLWLDYVGLDLGEGFGKVQKIDRRMSSLMMTPTRSNSRRSPMPSVGDNNLKSPTITRQASTLRPPDISNAELLEDFPEEGKEKKEEKESDSDEAADSDVDDADAADGASTTARVAHLHSSSVTRCLRELKPNLKEGLAHDYVIVSKPVWTALQSWYGGQEIARKVISVPVRRASDLNQSALDASTLEESTVVELYPLVFFVKSETLGRKPVELSCSRSSTLESLAESVCSLLGGVDKDSIRIWDMYRADDPKLITGAADVKLEDLDLVTCQDLLVEIQLENGRWLGVPSRVAAEDEEEEGLEYKEPKSVKNSVNSGISGFHNLGNTCFMNSAVQCLSQTRPLTDYFLSGFYKHEINLENPLGHGGEIARSFGRTIRDLWAMKKYRSLGPRRLKNSVGKMNSQFTGQQQQDASEFLTYLLDGLHEDLNRVLDKPYTQLEDSNGRPDHIVADEYWAAHVARNRSVVYDLFCGQQKSTLDFECGHSSIRFDPYTCLSLALPEPETKYISITVIYDDATRVPTKYTIPIPNDDHESTILKVKKDLAALCGCPVATLQIADVQRNLVWKFLGDFVSMSRVFSEQLFAYQVPSFAAVLAQMADAERQRKEEEAEEAKKAAEKPKFVPEDLEEGDVFDCKDTARKWLHAVVLEVKRPSAPGIEHEDADSKVSQAALEGDAAAAADAEAGGDASAAAKLAAEAEARVVLMQTAQQREMERRRRPAAHKRGAAVMLLVHYEGWASRWDEWVSTKEDANRIAEYNTKSQRAKGSGGVEHRPYNRNSQLAVPLDCVTIHCVHRRIISEKKKFFVAPFRNALFSRPVLLFLDPQTATCQDLYRLVWEKTRRAAQMTGGGSSTYSFDEKDDSKAESAYPPFVLKFVNRNGSYCAKCRWMEGCSGCEVPCTDELITKQRLANDTTIAVEWNPRFLEAHMDLVKMNQVWEHESVPRCKFLSSEDNRVSIGDCMTKFTVREVLEENPRCSKCRDFHENTTKTLSVWSFPPIITMHLKRLLPGRKLHTMVKAPIKNFDPRPFYDQYVLDHAEEIREANKAAEWDTAAEGGGSLSRDPSGLYDLYATVNHFGSSAGGHYTAYALSKSDGKWYVFDDSRVHPLPAEQEIITSNTYMLFYQKKGLDGEASLDFLPRDIRDKLQIDGKKACSIM